MSKNDNTNTEKIMKRAACMNTDSSNSLNVQLLKLN